MDYQQIQAAKEAGLATIELNKTAPMPVIPAATVDERITVTTKRFDTYTGQEVAPEVQTYRKADLLREVEMIDTQCAQAHARKLAIQSLLAEFEPKVDPFDLGA